MAATGRIRWVSVNEIGALSWRFRCSSGRSPVLADQTLDDVGALDLGGHIDRLAGHV